MAYEGDSYVIITDLVKQQNNRFTLSKSEADLFDDDKHLINAIINVKRNVTSKSEKWNIIRKIQDAPDEVIFVIDGSKLNKKEKAFLRTNNGVLLLLKEAKAGIKSFNALRKVIRENLE